MTDIEVIDRDNERADQLKREQVPFVWWDDQDPTNPGWVLRYWLNVDEWTDEPLDAADRDDPDEAADEARRMLPQPGNHPDDLRASLEEAGLRRADAERQRAEAMVDIHDLVPRARAAGIGPSDLAGLTGLSRRAVYDILGEHDHSPPSRA